MRVISCNFHWRVARLKDIYEAVELCTQTHLKSNQISIRRFPEVGWELVLEIDKRENIDNTVSIWLRQVGPCATNGLVNTKYKIYAIKNKNGHLPNSPHNINVPMSESIDYMLISRSTNKLKDQQKLGYSKVLLKDIIIPKEQGADVSKIIEGSIHLYCEVKLVYLNTSEILQNKYEMMLYDKTYADCIFKVGDEVIKAHRCVLAQSSDVFKKMFGEDVAMVEAKTGEVTISDTTPECFRALLEYFYYELENNVEGIFALAHKYQVETLQYECECCMANLLGLLRFKKNFF
ncbi:unnamed protein product [Meloidogyne enterolobii]|uniref:Uncharacterized protein n=1 Tax=Meloidogyne enterolobii TaxID=390850 RepID=A0ACB1A501_MELEN